MMTNYRYELQFIPLDRIILEILEEITNQVAYKRLALYHSRNVLIGFQIRRALVESKFKLT